MNKSTPRSLAGCHPPTSQAAHLPCEVAELASVVAELPPEYALRLQPVLARVVSCNKRRRRLLRMIQDAMTQLRLDMKYLLFDLEATRRERDACRRRLAE